MPGIGELVGAGGDGSIQPELLDVHSESRPEGAA